MRRLCKLVLNLFILSVITLINMGSTTTLRKEYELLFFKFGPEDLLVKIYPENFNETDEDKTDYIISKIDNKSAHVFLVKKSPNERNFVEYRYRVAFFKPQKFGNTKINVPIYSFSLYYDGDDIIVKYEPSKAVPKEIKDNNLEKRFSKDPRTNIFFLKDYDGEDFNLSERIRKVKFVGKVKNDNGTYTEITDDMGIKIRLLKVEDISKSSTSEKGVLKKDSFIEIPLNQDIYVGLVPYKIEDVSSLVRYTVTSILTNGKESQDTFIHFAEIWDNMYEQQLIFKDDGYFLDFTYDLNLFDINYSFDGKNFITCSESPLSLSLKENDGKTLKMNLISKNYVVKYLKNPTKEIIYDLAGLKRAVEAAKEINQKYPDITQIKKDGSLFINPDYKKTSFVIFSNPPRAKIKYKILEPAIKDTSSDYSEIGEAPIFFNELNYGIYSFKAFWYEKDFKSSEIKEYSEEMIVEFSEPVSENYFSNIKYLSKNENKIPYIEFFKSNKERELSKNSSIEESVLIVEHPDDKLVKDNGGVEKKSDVTGDVFLKSGKDLTEDKIKDEESLKLESITLGGLKNGKEASLYIQIKSVEIREFNIADLTSFSIAFITKYKSVNNKSFPIKPQLGTKNINNKNYIAVLVGPFSSKTAVDELKLIKNISFDAFVVRETDVGEYK